MTKNAVWVIKILYLQNEFNGSWLIVQNNFAHATNQNI